MSGVSSVVSLSARRSKTDVPRWKGRFWRRSLLWLANPYAFLDQAQATLGLTFRVRLPVVGDALITGEPELIRELMTHGDLDAGAPIDALRALLGSRSLIMLQGERHALRQSVIAPLFRGPEATRHETWMIEQMRSEIRALPRGRSFRAYDLAQRVALRAILAAFFGVDAAQEGEAERLVLRFLGSFRSPLILFLKPLRVDAGPLSPWGRAMRNRRQLCAYLQRQIQLHRQAPKATMLGRLLEAAQQSPPLEDEDLIQELLALLLFGHDTGAATMAWAIAHLYSDPRALEVAQREARRWNRVDGADPHGLPWLNACLNESMRLCPVVVHLTRRAARDTQLGGLPIAAGQTVIPCTYLAQHNPQVFAEPHAFRPQRFLHGQRYQGSFFPFGFGARVCVGKPWVSRQMPLLIASMLTTAELRLVSRDALKPARHMVLIAPRDGARMELLGR